MRPGRIEPAPGQESVWDYPRPPAVVPTGALVVVRFGGATVAETTSALRVLETSQAPAYYLPPDDVEQALLRPSSHPRTSCEWKGRARYVDVVVGDAVAAAAGWIYDDPLPGYESITGYVAFYPQRVDECWVDGERVTPNDGDFYGGWITSQVVGPFKGAPGSRGW